MRGAADQVLRCVSCGRVLGEFGLHWLVSVAVHPEGPRAAPTHAGGFSITCRRCRVHLDVALVLVPRAAPERPACQPPAGPQPPSQKTVSGWRTTG